MQRTAFLTCLLTVSLMNQVSGLETVTGKYGDTVEIPCNRGLVSDEGVTFVKWKSDKDGNILVKHTGQNATIPNDGNYKNRVSIKKDFGLVITQVSLADQKTFTCMVVAADDILEYPVQLVIYKTPLQPQIANLTTAMEIGKLTTLAECHTEGANPAANITWFKNKTPLIADGTAVKITSDVAVDKATGLSTTNSKLEYTAVKEDINSKFTCQVQHIKSANMDSSPLVFTVNYPSETVSFHVLPDGPVKEGDNVTLKCMADGNPPPTRYNFYIKGEKKTVEKSNIFILSNVTRQNTGEYKCSLVDNEKLAASKNITVEYLDVIFSTTGKVSKKLGESFDTTIDIKASGKTETFCKKGSEKLVGPPKFASLKYTDTGVYECVVTMLGLKKTQTFDLNVHGQPVIRSLTKKRGDGTNKILSCEAEGSPKPTVQWITNGTEVKIQESEHVNGKITYYITVSPRANVTVSCTVSNDLGSDTRSIDVSSHQSEDYGDQTALAVGIVVGLMLAALLIGLAYWLYMKKFRQGSWKTGEKEDGSAEESKKLEENQSQKAEV
ncbi:activated leukocyte cell adhesion molecule b isoform X2 [Danio aesculapii]|uniref:activated leukocyte cell adhesion molecule b isoform X2 n=1 Tax=Danio aesculapii TaxID=1142201 RepID=UPI0024BF5F95|nr:activated leukocyte cell adhesion molecule b isoform X2 [Danio aesculapii]